MKMRNLLRLIPAALLGVGAAVLVACGSSGKGLIPSANAGPLQSDFQAVVRAAQEGNGNCAPTEAQIRKTERALHALPTSVDGGLRGRLEEGVENLAARARALCSQPLAQTTTTATTPTTTTPPPATATTPPATTPPIETAPHTEAPSEEGGGTQAPHEEGRREEEGEAEAPPGHGNGRGGDGGNGNGNGEGAGGAPPGETGAGEVNGGTVGGR